MNRQVGRVEAGTTLAPQRIVERIARHDGRPDIHAAALAADRERRKEPLGSVGQRSHRWILDHRHDVVIDESIGDDPAIRRGRDHEQGPEHERSLRTRQRSHHPPPPRNHATGSLRRPRRMWANATGPENSTATLSSRLGVASSSNRVIVPLWPTTVAYRSRGPKKSTRCRSAAIAGSANAAAMRPGASVNGDGEPTKNTSPAVGSSTTKNGNDRANAASSARRSSRPIASAVTHWPNTPPG